MDPSRGLEARVLLAINIEIGKRIEKGAEDHGGRKRRHGGPGPPAPRPFAEVDQAACPEKAQKGKERKGVSDELQIAPPDEAEIGEDKSQEERVRGIRVRDPAPCGPQDADGARPKHPCKAHAFQQGPHPEV